MPSDETTLTIRRDVLESWMKITGFSRSHLAEQLSLSKGRISQILNSDQEPSARLIAGLLSLTHLPFDRLFALKKRTKPRTSGTSGLARPPRAKAQGADLEPVVEELQ